MSKMRFLVSSFLVLLITIVSLSKGIMVGYYNFNKAYIAANLCENKEKPAMKCDGKCYLRKQMQDTPPDMQAPAQAPKLADMVKNIQFPTLYFQVTAFPFLAEMSDFWAVLAASESTSFADLDFNLPMGIHLSVFRPPRA